MKKLICLIMTTVLLISLLSFGSSAALQGTFDPRRIAVCITHDASYDEFTPEYFSAFVPEDVEIESVRVMNASQSNKENYRAILELYIADPTEDKAIRLVEAIVAHPSVISADLDYYVYPDDPTPGDFNGDGKVNSRDLSLMKKYIAGGVAEEDVVIWNCDFDGNGMINGRDLTQMKLILTQV